MLLQMPHAEATRETAFSLFSAAKLNVCYSSKRGIRMNLFTTNN